MPNLKAIQNKCPCKDYRYTACHSDCEEYLDWKAELSEAKAIVYEQQTERIRTFPSSILRNIKRNVKY